MGKKPSARVEENPLQQRGGISKKKKALDDDENSIGTEVSEEQAAAAAEQDKPAGEKKGNAKAWNNDHPAKNPICQSKKSKPNHGNQIGAAAQTAETVEAKETTTDVGSEEPEKVEEVESMEVEDKVELPEAAEEDAVEDDVNLNAKGAFADEEADSVPEPIVKKEIKNAVPTQNAGATNKTVSKPVAEEVEEGKQANVVADKNKKHDPDLKREPQKSAVPPEENLRSPICCIMGHLETGKTKLMDFIIRGGPNGKKVDAGEVPTQQIDATYFPAENILESTKEFEADATLKVPGLLFIDTPGEDLFTYLRSRCSGLCDIAIVVVDIMLGLQKQAKECLNLLITRNTEFIVALNKVDRLEGWKTCRKIPIDKAIEQQSKDVQKDFYIRVNQIISEFKKEGLNTELYFKNFKNKEMGETFSIVPTSAISGEGVPDLLLLLVQWTQKTMVEKLTCSEKVQCTVLEAKVVEGHGTTIDVVLVNGVLREGDQIVVCGVQGPIVTKIRLLYVPRVVKGFSFRERYLPCEEVKAAMRIKIPAQGLERAIVGTGLYVLKADDNLEDVKMAAENDRQSVMRSWIDSPGEGVYLHASTPASLEALLVLMKTPQWSIPVSGINIGPVHNEDVKKASEMLENKQEYAAILAYDVYATCETRELADELGVKIIFGSSACVFSLLEQYKVYVDKVKEKKRREAADEAVIPCVLKILPSLTFKRNDPIRLSVEILEGTAKIVGRNREERLKMYGKDFGIHDELVSSYSGRSLDVLIAKYQDHLSTDEWRLLENKKNLFRV